MESLYFLALILCPYYSVSKCTLFGTTSALDLSLWVKRCQYLKVLTQIMSIHDEIIKKRYFSPLRLQLNL